MRRKKMASKKKYYCIIRGRKQGIFTSWEEVEQYVKGYKGAKYKGFKDLESAQDWILENEQS